MANPRDTHGRGHPARPHPGQRPAQRRGAGAEPAGLSLSLTRPSPGARGKDEHRHRLQLTGLRAPERPRTHLRHGSAARLGMCRCEVSGRAPGLPAARGSGRGALPSLPSPGPGPRQARPGPRHRRGFASPRSVGTALGDQGDGADLYSENITRILDKLLDGYDNRLRPGFGGSGEAPSRRGGGGWGRASGSAPAAPGSSGSSRSRGRREAMEPQKRR